MPGACSVQPGRTRSSSSEVSRGGGSPGSLQHDKFCLRAASSPLTAHRASCRVVRRSVSLVRSFARSLSLSLSLRLRTKPRHHSTNRAGDQPSQNISLIRPDATRWRLFPQNCCRRAGGPPHVVSATHMMRFESSSSFLLISGGERSSSSAIARCSSPDRLLKHAQKSPSTTPFTGKYAERKKS